MTVTQTTTTQPPPISTPAVTFDLSSKNSALWQNYVAKKEHDPLLFPTEGSRVLGVSEFELLLASPDSRYLGDRCRDMLLALARLGKVESIVRNDLAVHEKQGTFAKVELGDVVGMSLDDGQGALDLRLFLKHFAHMLATADGKKYVITFFDYSGRALLNVFLVDKSPQALDEWQQLTDEFAQNAPQTLRLESFTAPSPWQLDTPANTVLLHSDWQSLSDIHQFHDLLRQHKLDKLSAYHHAPKDCAWQLPRAAIEQVLHACHDDSVPVMIFVGNTGLVQIQTGTIKRIERLWGWLNIFDRKSGQFTLHLKDDALLQVWCVQRPSEGGGTTLAVEGFDKYGNSVVSFFGERTEGDVQCPKWQALIRRILTQYALAED